MTTTTHARLEIMDRWRSLNDTLLALVDRIPDDKLDWSPREDLWSFRKILAHVSSARENWLTPEGSDMEEFVGAAVSGERVKDQLKVSWSRVERFLSEQRYLDRVFEGSRGEFKYSYSGHWIAFHLLEHDIHHRADIFHYLALLNIEHPGVETP